MTTSTGVGREISGHCAPAIRPIDATPSPRLAPVFLLPRTTYICRQGDAFAFLDVPRDKYTLICGTHAAALRALMLEDHAAALSSASKEALMELASRGLLTMDRHSGKRIQVTSAEAPTLSINEIGACEQRGRCLRRTLDFGVSCTLALLWLRFRAFENIIRTLRNRKSRHGTRSGIDVVELTLFFHRARSMFPTDYLCLYDSLALIEFLARHNVFPDLVFAIRFEPWGAHCWVQHGRLLLNEDLEAAHGFVPIMVV